MNNDYDIFDFFDDLANYVKEKLSYLAIDSLDDLYVYSKVPSLQKILKNQF